MQHKSLFMSCQNPSQWTQTDYFYLIPSNLVFMLSYVFKEGKLKKCKTRNQVKSSVRIPLKGNGRQRTLTVDLAETVMGPWLLTYFGISEKKSFLQQRVDVRQRGVVHEKAQAGLEVTGNH